MKDFKFLAIFLGLILDIAGSLFSGIIIAILLMAYDALLGMSLKNIMVEMDAVHLSHNLLAQLLGLGFGEFFTFAGGFLVGWMARGYEVKNALTMGLVSAVLGLAFWSFYPAWYNIVCLLLTPAVGTAGGRVARIVFVSPRPPRA